MVTKNKFGEPSPKDLAKTELKQPEPGKLAKPNTLKTAKFQTGNAPVENEIAESDLQYQVVPNDEWRQRKLEWAKGVKEELADMIFSMAQDGADKKVIAAFFGIDQEQITEFFDEPFNMGRADLQMRIARKTVQIAMASKMPVATIWAGKVFNSFTEGVPIKDELDEAASGLHFQVNIIKSDRKVDDYITQVKKPELAERVDDVEVKH